MPSTCEFHLNSPNGVYYSGQVVSGTIVLKTTTEKNIPILSTNYISYSIQAFEFVSTANPRLDGPKQNIIESPMVAAELVLSIIGAMRYTSTTPQWFAVMAFYRLVLTHMSLTFHCHCPVPLRVRANMAIHDTPCG